MRKINLRKYALPVFSALAIVVLLVYTNTYKESVRDAVLACGNVLIPSLFPFFFFSSFIVYTDSLSPITRHMGIAGKILAIPKEGLTAVILSVIGGFPVGAKTTAALYAEGKVNRQQAKKLTYCCVGAGPGFLVTFIGENLLGSKQAGLMLLASDAVSVLVLLAVNRRGAYDNCKAKKVKTLSLGEAIVLSTEGAVRTTLSMCGFVMIFTVVNNLLTLMPYYNEYISNALEITSGTINHSGSMPYEAIAFFVGFGGICVHFQIYGVVREIGINKLQFVLMRILQGVISGATLHILLKIFPVSKAVFGNLTAKIVPSISGTVWGAAAIIMLSVIFLISIGRNNKREVNLCAE